MRISKLNTIIIFLFFKFNFLVLNNFLKWLLVLFLWTSLHGLRWFLAINYFLIYRNLALNSMRDSLRRFCPVDTLAFFLTNRCSRSPILGSLGNSLRHSLSKWIGIIAGTLISNR
jgi:hypothetical protein